MKRSVAIAAAAIAAIAVTTTSANAGGRHRHHHHHGQAAVVSSITGAISQGIAWGVHSSHHHVGGHSSGTHWGVYGAGVAGCLVVSPIVSTIILNRPLTMREAWVGGGNCVLPVIGGIIVDHMFAHHGWDHGPKMAKKGNKKKKKM